MPPPKKHDRLPLLHEAGWQGGWLQPPPPTESHAPRAITLKFGGSMLTRPTWPGLLRRLLNAFEMPVHIVCGGGAVVEGLRHYDAAVPQPPVRMHRLAIAGMALNARMVAEELGLPLLQQLPPVDDRQDRGGLIDPTYWLDAGLFDHLPASWSVTSDSLAAVVAHSFAEPLLLAKQCPPPASVVPGSSGPHLYQQLAAAGWIDPHLAAVCSSVCSVAWAAPREDMA